MTPREIGALLKTQDNRITAEPIFMVQERHRFYGMRPAWAMPFFTEAAAQAWIDRNQHNYERPLRVYVASGHSNPEWKAIRAWLMEQAS